MDVIVYLNARCKEILSLLMSANTHMTIDEIAKAKTVSRRSIYYDLCKINEWLEYHKIPQIEVERGKGIYLTPEQNRLLAHLTDQPDEAAGYVFSPGERVRAMICMIGTSLETIGIEELMSFCQVSRNTVFNDLKVATTLLQKYDLHLQYETKRGYRIEGDTVCRRTVCLHYFYSMISLYTSGVLRLHNRDTVQEQMDRFHAVENRLNIHYPEEMLLGLTTLMPGMERGQDVLDLRDISIREVVSSREFSAVAEYFPHLIESEQIYLAVHLMGTRVLGVGVNVNRDNDLYNAARSLVAEFERMADVHFDYSTDVERALFMHLKSSWYRFRYGIRMEGAPLVHDMLRTNVELFEVTKKACEYLETELALPISDSEVAYLALNFAGYMRQSIHTGDQLRILIVCCQGMTTGHMLRWEISSLLPKARVVDVVAVQDVFNVKDICDVVISTVPVKSDVPVQVVHPIMTDKERIAVLRLGAGNAEILSAAESITPQEIMNIVQKYVPVEAWSALCSELDQYVEDKAKRSLMLEARNNHGLIRYLTVDKIRLCDRNMEWREALHYVAEPLVHRGSIETGYVDSIVSMIETMGTYMFFVPGLILAHAKPDHHVRHMDVSVGVFRQPVEFSQYRHAKIIIMLAPVDKDSHLEILRDIMRVFAVQTRIDDLQQAGSSMGVLENLQKYCFDSNSQYLEE